MAPLSLHFPLPSSPFHFLSPRSISISRRRSFVCSLSSAPDHARSRSAILWFKHDLRLDDHPALSAAAQTHRSLLPLYVFDHRILSRYSDDTLELLILALEDLRKSLKEQGSDLMIRFGYAENIIKQLVKEVKATDVFIEEEVEYEMHQLIQVVKETLESSSSSLDGNLDIVMWATPFYDIKKLKELPASYNDFKKLKLLPASPLLPATLPVAEIESDWGSLPTLNDLKEFMKERIGKSKESWDLMKEKSAEVILKENLSKQSGSMTKSLNVESIERRRLDKSVFVTRKGDIVSGGTNSVLNALAAYLRYLEGTARDDWQEVHERLRNVETREGASFYSLFGPALCLGIISRRRVYYEAIKYEKERNAGFLSPFGYSAVSVAAAADAVCSMEWFWLLAKKTQLENGLYPIRIWRWRGHLIQYTVVGHEGPAILLVHGFGAFLEHYRDNINDIAERGNRVWAITLLGFGKSEKPNVVYTELLWAELLRDFIIEVVGEPVHQVGNSIGGYFASIVAGLWPSLVKSVILINSAGNVIPGFSSRRFSNERQTPAAAGLVAQVLLFYLRLNIRNTLKTFYPTKTNRVDDWLINEMLRASYDPGVLVVLESIFTFDLSIPLNYLLERYEEKVLILQGMKDPLLDSKAKLAMLKEHCTDLVIRELDAGHCPHDEQPQKVNSTICEWIVAVERKLTANSYL